MSRVAVPRGILRQVVGDVGARVGGAPGIAAAVGVLGLEHGVRRQEPVGAGESAALGAKSCADPRRQRAQVDVEVYGCFRRDAQHVGVAIRRAFRRVEGWDQMGCACQLPLEALPVAQRVGVGGVESAQLAEGEGCGQIGGAVHPAETVVMVFATGFRWPHVAETGYGFATDEGGFVVGDEEAALTAGEVLVLVEAEGGSITEGAHLAALAGCAHRLTGIFDHRQAMAPGDRHDGVHVAGDAPVVHDQNAPRLGCDRRFDRSGIDVHRLPVDINEDGNRVVVQDTRGTAGPREGRCDDFVPRSDATGGDTHVQRRCAAVGGEAETVAIPGGEFALQQFGVGTKGMSVLAQRGQHKCLALLSYLGPHAKLNFFGDGAGATDDGELIKHGSPGGYRSHVV